MKVRSIIALTLALVLTGAAHARQSYGGYDNWNESRYSNYGDRSHRYQPVQLNLAYKANGSQRIPLRRLIQSQHNIDTSAYRIRTVTIRNKSRYNACADLRVGRRSTGPVYLRRGVTTINAPQGRSDGRWILHVDEARVRWISVVLEPKHEYASRERDWRYAHNDRDDRRYRTQRNRWYFR